MGIASLILGILGIVSAFTLIFSPFGLIFVVIGLVLGIVDVVKKGKTGGKRGCGIAGIVICAFMTIVLMIETFITLLSLGIYLNSKDAIDINSSYNTTSSYNTSTEVDTFNSKFSKYEGRVTGSYVNLLLSIISINNSTSSQNEVLCFLDGNIYEPNIAKNQILTSRYYQVSFDYDSNGYIEI